MEQEPARPEGARQLGQLVPFGKSAAALEKAAQPFGVTLAEPVQRLEDDAGVTSLRRKDECRYPVVADFGVSRRSLGKQLRVRGDVRGGVRASKRRTRRRQLGVAKVHVGRVERVRLDRQGFECPEPIEALREQPLRLAGRGRYLSDGRLVDEAEGQIGRRLARSHGTRFGGCPGDVGHRGPLGGTHPSEPSISSLTSRLNSMAYSIGNSLVKTSRNPWTTRFVASFSVRPRLIR